MMLRDHEGVKGKRDAYPFDPRLLKIDASYNVRDLSSPEAQEKLAELKESIRANGVKVPLEVRFDGADVYVVSGHRRLAAVLDLIKDGEPIETVLTIAEAKGTNDAERTLNLVTSNSGEPLKPLEVAEVVRRLVAFGWEHSNIAKRMGWKSASSVNHYLDMLAMPETVKQQVRDGDISASLARKVVRDAKTDPEFAAELIRKNKEENERLGVGKRAKVTPKTIKRDTEKAKPRSDQAAAPAAPATELPPEQQPAASVELPPASVPESLGAPNPNYPDRELDAETAASMRNAETHSEHPDADLHQATLAKVEEHNGWHPDADPLPATNGNGSSSKYLIDALEPFAALAEFNDLNAEDDDDLMEVKVGDVKRAWRAYNAATGGQS